MDLVAFLKCIGIVPDLLSVDEVPEIFAGVVNASPVQQVPMYEASISVTQVLVVLVHGALISYGRPPYSSKYATREEKVMATLELVEVAYLSIFNRYMPLQARTSFPSAARTLQGLTLESELRDFLLTRRLERGMALVPAAKSSRAQEAEEDFRLTNAGRHATRSFSAIPERDDGTRPVAIGIPCLIREQLFAPAAPHPVGPLMETALMHHNAARYKAAVEAYLQVVK